MEDIEAASQMAYTSINGIITFTYRADMKTRKERLMHFSQLFLKGIDK
ncbi:TetR family transcriptional regulator C-terminal domain-containing protein [Lysinibacillus louembei]